MMVYTGVDGEKVFSVRYNLFTKKWSPTNKVGKKICVVPSDFCFVKIEKAFTKNLSQLRGYYQIEVSEKFGDVAWDLSLWQEKVILGVYKNFSGEACQRIDLEVFSLARVLRLLGVDGYVLDLGRRKTTLVKVENGLLKSYRVLLRGGDYLSSLADREEGERLKKEKGLELKEVYEGFKKMIDSLNMEEAPVLLSGGGAKLKGIKDFFKRTIENPYCEPTYTSAFGASLVPIVKTPYPDFAQRELSKEELRVLGATLFAGLLVFGLSYFSMERLWSVDRLREREREEFKKLFPNAPATAIREQVLSRATREEPFQLTSKLLELAPNLREGIKVYSIEFSEGGLLVKGEGKEELVSQMKTKMVKKTPLGTLEFELELR